MLRGLRSLQFVHLDVCMYNCTHIYVCVYVYIYTLNVQTHKVFQGEITPNIFNIYL